MKRIATIIAIALVAAGMGVAQTKIGIVNVQRAIASTAEIKAKIADGNARYRPREVEIEKLRTDLQDIEQRLSGGNLSAADEQTARAEGQRKQRQLERKTTDLRDEVSRERDEIIGRARQRMLQVIEKIATDRGLDVVADSPAAIFVKTALDITDEAVAAYDKAYPAK